VVARIAERAQTRAAASADVCGDGRPIATVFHLGRPAAPAPSLAAVDARVRIVKEDLTCMLPYQIGEAVFRWKNRSFALRVGIRWKRELHWWQWLRIEELWSGPLVKAVRIGGYIEAETLKAAEFRTKQTFFWQPAPAQA